MKHTIFGADSRHPHAAHRRSPQIPPSDFQRVLGEENILTLKIDMLNDFNQPLHHAKDNVGSLFYHHSDQEIWPGTVCPPM